MEAAVSFYEVYVINVHGTTISQVINGFDYNTTNEFSLVEHRPVFQVPRTEELIVVNADHQNNGGYPTTFLDTDQNINTLS